ncbi:MAG: TetR/AcrR family transcriptional regulator [Pseudomonadales bacterium]|nr:TetR/AcrR family transcriptional regulator [Pseudomonadales bacterium]
MSRKRVSDTVDRTLLSPKIQRRIENAVLELFSDRPLSQVGFSEIAKSANTSLQTIYRYYGTKEALLSASLEHWLGQLTATVSDNLSQTENYKERMRKGFSVVLDYFEKHPKVALLAQHAIADDSTEQSDPLVKQQFSKMLLSEIEKGQEQGVLNKDVSGDILFDYFAGVFIRLVQGNIVRRSKESISGQANVLFELLWRAIADPAHDQFSS